MPARLSARLLTSGLVVALAAGIGLPATAASAAPEPSTKAAKAQEALAQASSLFAGSTTAKERRAAQRTGTARDATLVLRDLALTAADLPTRAQRQTATRILARPDDSGGSPIEGEPQYESTAGVYCGAAGDHVCVHWVEDSSADSVQGIGSTGNDRNLTTVPQQVKTTLTTLEHVYDEEVTRLGYRAPVSDGIQGGNGKLDVYLGDIGDSLYYGYCSGEASSPLAGSTAAAYCVLDNDYDADQYGDTSTPLENLQVTAAHEFFHAVQFAYDWTEDVWFMEGTAAWMEDEVYDAVNDNLQYLPQSPLRYPSVPLDHSDAAYLPYGNWAFWKFLSEWQGTGAADDPTVVRATWEAADGAAYSTSALIKVLTARGDTFTDAFTRFGTWTRNPAAYFSEGSAYPTAPQLSAYTLTSSSRTTGPRVRKLDHLTHRFYGVTPGATLTGSWGLSVAVNMASLYRGSVARVVLHKQDGTLAAYAVPLNSYGNGSRTVDFRRTVVKYVEVELGNASTRFDCNQGTYLSCQGIALDDDLDGTFTATAVRT